MGISRTEAASALTDIESTTGRSRVLRGYQIAGPILVVWGAIWGVGYCAMGLLAPAQWNLVGLVLDVVGIAATVLLGRRGATRARAAKAGQGWKIGAGVLATAAFYAATFALFRPDSLDAALAYPGVVTGFIYAGIGIAFWMAAVGGGGLIVGGLWLRRA